MLLNDKRTGKIIHVSEVMKKIAALLLVPVFLLEISEKASGETGTVAVLKKEDFSIDVETTVDVYYCNRSEIRYTTDYSNANFIDYFVEIGDHVEKGDAVAEITSNADPAEIKEQELKYQRAVEDLADIQDNKTRALTRAQSQIEAYTRSYAEAGTEYCNLEIESINLDYDRQIANQQEYIDEINDRLQEMYSAKNTVVIKAPISGTIADLYRFKEGDVINDDEYIGLINEEDKVLYSLKDSGNVFRYGMELTFADYSGNKYTGRVVSCSAPVLTSGITSDTVYISVDDLPEDIPMRLKAYYTTISYKNVIVLDDGEYYTDDKGTYVLESTAFGNIRHYFTASRKISGSVIALDGLSEGMEIIVE